MNNNIEILKNAITELIMPNKSLLTEQKEIGEMKYKNTTIRKRKDGRWYGRVKIAPQTYKDIYGTTQKQAYNAVKEFVKELEMEQVVKMTTKKQKNTIPTLAEFYETWLKEKRSNCKESTIKKMQGIWKNRIQQSGLAKKKISSITGEDIHQLIINAPTKATQSRLYIQIKDIFTCAQRLRLIKEVPTYAVKVPKYKNKKPHPFTLEEECKFIAIAKNYDCYPIFALMLYEGLRTSEAKAITPIDIKDTYIVIDKSIDDYGNFISTKTDTVRYVPIFDDFKEVADKYRGSSNLPILGKVNKHTAVKEYKEICNQVGISKNMYSLRHTFATRCAEKGVSPKQTSIWLGHSDIETTFNYYTASTKELELDSIKKKNQ